MNLKDMLFSFDCYNSPWPEENDWSYNPSIDAMFYSQNHTKGEGEILKELEENHRYISIAPTICQIRYIAGKIYDIIFRLWRPSISEKQCKTLLEDFKMFTARIYRLKEITEFVQELWSLWYGITFLSHKPQTHSRKARITRLESRAMRYYSRTWKNFKTTYCHLNRIFERIGIGLMYFIPRYSLGSYLGFDDVSMNEDSESSLNTSKKILGVPANPYLRLLLILDVIDHLPYLRMSEWSYLDFFEILNEIIPDVGVSLQCSNDCILENKPECTNCRPLLAFMNEFSKGLCEKAKQSAEPVPHTDREVDMWVKKSIELNKEEIVYRLLRDWRVPTHQISNGKITYIKGNSEILGLRLVSMESLRQQIMKGEGLECILQKAGACLGSSDCGFIEILKGLWTRKDLIVPNNNWRKPACI